MRRIGLALGFLWTIPNTILGLVAGLMSLQWPRLHAGALLFDRAGRRGFARLIPLFGYSAMTLGFVVISVVPLGGLLLEHERHHVRQYAMWGPLFLPAYGLLFLIRGYERHPFERAARRAAESAPNRNPDSVVSPRARLPFQ